MSVVVIGRLQHADHCLSDL